MIYNFCAFNSEDNILARGFWLDIKIEIDMKTTLTSTFLSNKKNRENKNKNEFLRSEKLFYYHFSNFFLNILIQSTAELFLYYSSLFFFFLSILLTAQFHIYRYSLFSFQLIPLTSILFTFYEMRIEVLLKILFHDKW